MNATAPAKMEDFAAPARDLTAGFPVVEAMMCVAATSSVLAAACYVVLNFLG